MDDSDLTLSAVPCAGPPVESAPSEPLDPIVPKDVGMDVAASFANDGVIENLADEAQLSRSLLNVSGADPFRPIPPYPVCVP